VKNFTLKLSVVGADISSVEDIAKAALVDAIAEMTRHHEASESWDSDEAECSWRTSRPLMPDEAHDS
jgi:hypothetical protein